jgi:hypothetical protein
VKDQDTEKHSKIFAIQRDISERERETYFICFDKIDVSRRNAVGTNWGSKKC